MGFWDIRGSSSTKTAIVLGMIPVILIIGIWWYITRGSAEERIVSPVTLPSPAEVVRAIPSLISAAHLFPAIGASFRRVAIGFLIALTVALPLGISMGSFGKIRVMFSPLAVMSGYLPIAALVPLTLSWFGTDESQKYAFLAIAFFVYLLPMVIEAMDKVDEVYLQTAYTLGASKAQVILRVLFPIAAYDIYQAMRLAFGVGWTYIILAEIVMAEAGLGQIITIAQRRGPREHMYLVIIVIAVLAWLTDKVWGFVGKWLFPYKMTAAAAE